MLGWDVNWLWYFGWCLSAWGSYSFPPALLYHFATIFTVSYFFHSSLCFLLILPPTQFPSPFFNLIFHVSSPFLVNLLYLEGIWDFRTERGKTCDAHFSRRSSHLHKLCQPWLSRDRKKSLCNYATVATTNKATTLTRMHTNTQSLRELQLYEERLPWHCFDIACLEFFSIIHLLK